MKSMLLFVASIVAVILISMSMANADEKTITPKEFATTISEVPSKVGNFISNEVEKTKAYQIKVWSEAKTKWPWTMFKGDFVCSSPNDGTHYFRPVTARAQTFWQKQNYNRFVVDNTEDYYIVKSVDSEKICNEIRQNNMDFTS
jgi:hypothetical protein